MFFRTLLIVLTAAAAAQAAVIPPGKDQPSPPVFTATRVFQTLTDVPPYIITATTTMTWTYALQLLSNIVPHSPQVRAPAPPSHTPPAPGNSSPYTVHVPLRTFHEDFRDDHARIRIATVSLILSSFANSLLYNRVSCVSYLCPAMTLNDEPYRPGRSSRSISF
ncbi:hypothetical protein B0H11DRAFT_656900 [Mycena galericulata]|nr:hypothetical protein B0H11DRAFT_656900 [Mycena galericulata]